MTEFWQGFALGAMCMFVFLDVLFLWLVFSEPADHGIDEPPEW